MVNNNSDQRDEKRYQYEATIWHDNLFPEMFYETKMYNLSKGGIYFESDQTLYAGEKIYIAIKNPSASDNDYKDCVQVEIKWRKNLTDSNVQYGYGARFTDSRNTLLASIDTANLAKESLPSARGHKYKKDSRQNPRSPYRRVTFFTTNDRNYKGFITNISRSGAFIVSKYKFALGQKIMLVIPGDKKHGHVKLEGSVVRLSTKGAGVKFDRRTGVERRKGGDRRKKGRRTLKNNASNRH
jgi:Tfp pilus assembly protein PilZ